jgi:cupin 2 domain-containing protein
MKIKNIFHLLPAESSEDEFFEVLLKNENVKIERIISRGQVTALDIWLEEEQNEWVCLIQGCSKIEFQNIGTMNLNSGDYMLIPAKTKHRILYTSAAPPCVWLAVYSN